MNHAISLDTAVSFLATAPQLAGLDQAERAEVVRIMQVQRYEDGEVLFREGEAGDAWYIVFEGQAEVLKGDRRVALLDPGACVGEMSILDGSARSATVKAAGALTVFRFRRPLFEELLEDGSLAAYKLVLAMARALSERQRNLTARLVEAMGHERSSSSGAVLHEIAGVIDELRITE